MLINVNDILICDLKFVLFSLSNLNLTESLCMRIAQWQGVQL